VDEQSPQGSLTASILWRWIGLKNQFSISAIPVPRHRGFEHISPTAASSPVPAFPWCLGPRHRLHHLSSVPVSQNQRWVMRWLPTVLLWVGQGGSTPSYCVDRLAMGVWIPGIEAKCMTSNWVALWKGKEKLWSPLRCPVIGWMCVHEFLTQCTFMCVYNHTCTWTYVTFVLICICLHMCKHLWAHEFLFI
jgi:hypothetical protein